MTHEFKMSPFALAHHLRTAADQYEVSRDGSNEKVAKAEAALTAATTAADTQDAIARISEFEREAAMFAKQAQDALDMAEALDATENLSIAGGEILVARPTDADLYRVRSGG